MLCIYNFFVGKFQDDKNVAHLTHASEMQKKIDTLSRMTQILKDVIQNKVNNFFFTCLLKSSLLLKKGLCILPVHLSSVLFSIYFIVLKIEKLEFLLKNVLETLASEGVLRLFYRFFNS